MSQTGEVEVEVAGRKYKGTYVVSQDRVPFITVSCLDPLGSETTQVGTSDAIGLAHRLLFEIVNKKK